MPEIFIPTRSEIEALKDRDFATDCFGHWRRVTKVNANRCNTVIFTADGEAACHKCGY